MIRLYLIFLLVFISSSVCIRGQQEQEGCGKSCTTLNDCPGRLACRFGKCDDDPQVGTNVCASSSNSSCKPSKTLLYKNKTQCEDCCQQGSTYNFYTCSPPLQQQNFATLYATNFTPEAGGAARCNGKYYNSTERVVALSTGWYSNGLNCLKSINISAKNNSVTARIVDECSSTDGCNKELSYFPPCDKSSISATDAVWKGLGIQENDSQYGEMDVTWSFVSSYSSNVPPSKAPAYAPAPSRSALPSKSRNHSAIVAAATGSAAFVLLVLACTSIPYCARYRKFKALKQDANQQLLDSMQVGLLPQQFKYRDLERATGNFDGKLKLGEGGFGLVFKGILSDGTTVAVKRMEGARPGHKEFRAEVMSIGSIHHVNLVKLRGFCIHSPVHMLVYEYMPNGSLDKWIFNSENYLDWNRRLCIALDIAQGLAYLHHGCSERVLHLDIKPQNILLDENFRAKISDFGLSKLTDRDKSHVVTNVRGTVGYMAPEWLQSRVTEKTDVFSFGILLLEIVSSKKSLQIPTKTDSREIKLLREVALQIFFPGGDIMELVDRRLLEASENLEMAQVEKLIRIGTWCIQEDPLLRPSMAVVVKMLEVVVDVSEPPLSSTQTATSLQSFTATSSEQASISSSLSGR